MYYPSTSPASSIYSLSDDVEIRSLSSADITKVLELHALTQPSPTSSSNLRQFLLHPTRICLIAHAPSRSDTPIAFVTASISTPTHDLHASKSPEPRVQIIALGVLPEYRRNGIARRLVHNAIRNLREAAKTSVLTETKSIVDNETTMVTAHIPVQNEDGRKFCEHGLGMRSENQIITNWYRSTSIPLSERDAVVVVGRLREPMSPGHYEVMF